MKEIFSEYSHNHIITILSELDKDKQDRILQRCSNPDILAMAINEAIKCMSKICNNAEKLLSDDIISAILGTFYLAYTKKEKEAEKNNEVTLSISKELASLLTDDYEEIEKGEVKGFCIGDIFLEIV